MNSEAESILPWHDGPTHRVSVYETDADVLFDRIESGDFAQPSAEWREFLSDYEDEVAVLTAASNALWLDDDPRLCLQLLEPDFGGGCCSSVAALRLRLIDDAYAVVAVAGAAND